MPPKKKIKKVKKKKNIFKYVPNRFNIPEYIDQYKAADQMNIKFILLDPINPLMNIQSTVPNITTLDNLEYLINEKFQNSIKTITFYNSNKEIIDKKINIKDIKTLFINNELNIYYDFTATHSPVL